MNSGKSSNQKKTGQYYIEIVDDTLTDDYQKWQRHSSYAMAILIGLFVCPLLAALVTPLFPKAGVSIVGAFTLSIVIYVVLCFFVMRKKSKKVEVVENKETRQSISKKDYDKLKELLTRFGSFTASMGRGYILSGKKMTALYTVPLYGIATNPRIHRRHFIRANHDVDLFTQKDKKLVEKVFGYDNQDDVIWFSQKNIVKAAAITATPVIKFSDRNGDKMCFAHTQYSTFYDHRELSLENGECVIHIKDKRPDYKKTQGVGNTGNQDVEEYYDDDI